MPLCGGLSVSPLVSLEGQRSGSVGGGGLEGGISHSLPFNAPTFGGSTHGAIFQPHLGDRESIGVGGAGFRAEVALEVASASPRSAEGLWSRRLQGVGALFSTCHG